VLADQIANLEERVDSSDDQLTTVESDIKYAEATLDDLREELESARTTADRAEMLAEERDALEAEIRDLRSRKDRVITETREAFDDAISDVVEAFDTGFESAHLTGNFDLVVARDGREVDRDALSEGEVELLGIVTALAGFEAYGVDEFVPAILLDRLGGLADDNLGTLVEYLRDRTEFLVLTAYPENEIVDGWEINPTEWSVVSDQRAKAV
jgi:hypothetical protein